MISKETAKREIAKFKGYLDDDMILRLQIAIGRLSDEDKWTPCDEGLPKESGDYLVWENCFGDPEEYPMVETFDCDGKLAQWDAGYATKIIAWYPLPPKFREGR